jgi:hypothetical protein
MLGNKPLESTRQPTDETRQEEHSESPCVRWLVDKCVHIRVRAIACHLFEVECQRRVGLLCQSKHGVRTEPHFLIEHSRKVHTKKRHARVGNRIHQPTNHRRRFGAHHEILAAKRHNLWCTRQATAGRHNVRVQATARNQHVASHFSHAVWRLHLQMCAPMAVTNAHHLMFQKDVGLGDGGGVGGTLLLLGGKSCSQLVCQRGNQCRVVNDRDMWHMQCSSTANVRLDLLYVASAYNTRATSNAIGGCALM